MEDERRERDARRSLPARFISSPRWKGHCHSEEKGNGDGAIKTLRTNGSRKEGRKEGKGWHRRNNEKESKRQEEERMVG